MNFPANATNAPCKTQDPELFFKDQYVETAKTVCRSCPILDDCLSYALRNNVLGVWGATDEHERKVLRERHGIKAEPLSFSSGPTNAAAVSRMFNRGRKISDIAAHLGITPEAVSQVIRTIKARRDSEGRPPLPDPATPTPCPDCGSVMRLSSIRKHRKGYCRREQVAS